MRRILSGFRLNKTKIVPAGKGTVKDLIEEIKNLSELMLDLSYSSVFFENKEIAEEVNMLFERLEILEEHLYMHLFAASRGRAVKKMISVIALVESAKQVASAAKNISDIIIDNHELHPVIKSALKESDESITRVAVSKTSILKNKSIGDLRLRSNTGVDVVAIRRSKRWIFDPRKATTIKSGDVLIGVGPVGACERLKLIAEGKLQEI